MENSCEGLVTVGKERSKFGDDLIGEVVNVGEFSCNFRKLQQTDEIKLSENPEKHVDVTESDNIHMLFKYYSRFGSDTKKNTSYHDHSELDCTVFEESDDDSDIGDQDDDDYIQEASNEEDDICYDTMDEEEGDTEEETDDEGEYQPENSDNDDHNEDKYVQDLEEDEEDDEMQST
ncbi:PREDICTED: acidic leucine-rich nuclear phosphoprotein 32 family member B-like [Camelina sativa]|uniref:Acidic leucine-rich nuclear phosphoprotein 32 family member B-like n=1 Tax=Camelina sativa TaxID=90675 RepID=A0ABM0Y5Z6_CAMSA|nr:PREDICTED: acidic leucine-rich nuclear phosphoprotein 32 family member B-like [Camelina sativa]